MNDDEPTAADSSPPEPWLARLKAAVDAGYYVADTEADEPGSRVPPPPAASSAGQNTRASFLRHWRDTHGGGA